MDFIVLFLVSIFASCLTFFCGFGLGTILLPVFLVFYIPEIAIPAVALVHFSNSIFKFFAVYKFVNKKIFIQFGVPAIFASFFGALFFTYLLNLPNLFSYTFFEKTIQVSLVNFLIGALILIFTMVESSKRINKINFSGNHLIFGGILSGFFGGISGHQGALRSLFLKQTSLNKQELIGSSNAISLVIDLVRISTYFQFLSFSGIFKTNETLHILTGIIGAFIGVRLGLKYLHKISLQKVHKIISIALILFALLLMLGII